MASIDDRERVAYVFFQEAKYEEAASILREVVSVRIAQQDTPATCRAQANLAACLIHLDRPSDRSEAFDLMNAVMEADKKLRGSGLNTEMELEIRDRESNLVHFFRHTGDFSIARQRQERVVGDMIRLTGSRSYRTCSAMHNLAEILKNLGGERNLADAAALEEYALEVLQQLRPGPEVDATGIERARVNSRSTFIGAKGRLTASMAEGVEFMARELSMHVEHAAKHLGADDPSTRAAAAALRYVLRSAGRRDDAAEVERKYLRKLSRPMTPEERRGFAAGGADEVS